MNESNFTRQVLAELRNREAVVFKHADRFTAGIPDISCTTRGKTTWLEIKYVDKGDTVPKRVAEDMMQLRTMQLLAKNGRAAYIAYDKGHLTFWHPEHLVKCIVTDKRLSWEEEDYRKISPESCMLYLEDLVKGGRNKMPLCFTEYDLRPIRYLVEV